MVPCYYEGPKMVSVSWFPWSKIQPSWQLGGFSRNSFGQVEKAKPSITVCDHVEQVFLPVFHHHPTLYSTGCTGWWENRVNCTLERRRPVENRPNGDTPLASHTQHTQCSLTLNTGKKDFYFFVLQTNGALMYHSVSTNIIKRMLKIWKQNIRSLTVSYQTVTEI